MSKNVFFKFIYVGKDIKLRVEGWMEFYKYDDKIIEFEGKKGLFVVILLICLVDVYLVFIYFI